MMVIMALCMNSPKAIIPLRDGKEFLYIGVKTTESSCSKFALMPQEAPIKMTKPMRKNALMVPTELNLVKMVGDFKLIIGRTTIKNKGTVW